MNIIYKIYIESEIIEHSFFMNDAGKYTIRHRDIESGHTIGFLATHETYEKSLEMYKAFIEKVKNIERCYNEKCSNCNK